MLAQLKALHVDLRAAIAALAAETALAAPADETLSAARLKLSRLSRQRRLLIETMIYPQLHDAAPGDATRLAELQAETADMLARSSQHIGRWTMCAIRADWPGYRHASAEMRAAMLKRIGDERDILYPPLMALAIDQAA